MNQNRSTAVMQRRKVAPDSLNYFPTPPWATRAICELLAEQLGDLGALSVWEPACGEGHMVKPLLEQFGAMRMSDVHRYPLPDGLGDHELVDFALFGDGEPPVDVVFSNPPFPLAQIFIANGLKVARRAVVMLVRTAFSEGQDRYHELWLPQRPTFELVFSERVVMLEGRLIQAGAIDPFAEKPGTKASTATAYVAYVWLKGDDGTVQLLGGDTRKRWIPPCRQRLERRGDYPNYATEILPPPADGLFGPSSELGTGEEDRLCA